MATGFGNLRRRDLLDWLAGHAPSAPGAFSVGLWVGDPGEAGAGGAEVTSGNSSYVRGTITNNTGWTAATNASPSVLVNGATITFNSGTTDTWSSGSTITHVALWTAAGTTAANYIGRAIISAGGVVVGAGTTSVTIAGSGLSMTMAST